MAKSSESIIPRRIDSSENSDGADAIPMSGLRAPRQVGIERERGWPSGLRRRLVAVAAPERASILLGLVAHHVAAVTGHGSTHALEADARWRQLGIYGKFAAQLRDRLSEATGFRLPVMSFFDYRTPSAFVGYLQGALLGGTATQEEREGELLRDVRDVMGLAHQEPANQTTRASSETRRHKAWRGTTLIAGGTGAVGAHAARWLARNGAEHLMLVSRRGVNSPGAAELMVELAMLGSRVTIVACDIADRDGVASLLASLNAKRPLTSVVHAVGVSGRFAPPTDAEGGGSQNEFAKAVSGKVAGAVHLDALLGGRRKHLFDDAPGGASVESRT